MQKNSKKTYWLCTWNLSYQFRLIAYIGLDYILGSTFNQDQLIIKGHAGTSSYKVFYSFLYKLLSSKSVDRIVQLQLEQSTLPGMLFSCSSIAYEVNRCRAFLGKYAAVWLVHTVSSGTCYDDV